MDLKTFVQSDGWLLAVGLANVLAGLLAVIAIVIATRAQAKATQQLASERRLDFEIDALLTLMDRLDPLVAGDGALQRRVRLIAADDLPVTRWAIRDVGAWPLPGVEPHPEPGYTPSSPRGRWQFTDADGNMSHRVSQLMVDELMKAIETRVTARG